MRELEAIEDAEKLANFIDYLPDAHWRLIWKGGSSME
jgi:hypothetical protein